MSKGQVFSADVAFGIVIFLIAFAIFLGLLVVRTSQPTEVVVQENELVTESLVREGNLNVLDEAENIDYQKVEDIQTMPYDQIRQELGITSKFCIVFLDEDGNYIKELGSIGDPNTSYTVKSPGGDVMMSCDNRVLS